jgi:hypothetical protein
MFERMSTTMNINARGYLGQGFAQERMVLRLARLGVERSEYCSRLRVSHANGSDARVYVEEELVVAVTRPGKESENARPRNGAVIISTLRQAAR